MSFDHPGEKPADSYADSYADFYADSSADSNADSSADSPTGAKKGAKKGSKKWVGAAAAAAVVVALTVGGVSAVSSLSGAGPQPEDVLPANAIAFAKLDLNPSAGQKLAAYQLSSKFPKVKDKVTSEETSIKESIFGSIFTGDKGLGLDYEKDVAPWLGERVGVGVFPGMDADKKFEYGMAIAFTDQGAAKMALDKAVAKTSAGRNKVGYAFADGFAIVSDTNAHATAMVRAGKVSSLAGSSYTEDVKKLGADQFGVAWVDVGAANKAVPQSLKPTVPAAFLMKAGSTKASGRFVVGLHADASFLELNGLGIDVKGAESVFKAEAGAEMGMLNNFPSTVIAAATFNGLGAAVGAIYTALPARGMAQQVKSAMGRVGIDSARKIETLLGAEAGIMVANGAGSRPQFAIRTRSKSPDAALAVAQRVLLKLNATQQIRAAKVTVPDGIVIGMGPDLTSALVNHTGGTLGSTDAFKEVFPTPEKADAAQYVNLAKLVSLIPKNAKSTPYMDWLEPLSALGMTASGGEQPSLRLRISVKR